MGGEQGPITYKVAIAVPVPGPLQVVTARHENLVVEAYPVPPYLLLQCTGRDEDFDDARAVLVSSGSVVRDSRGAGRMTLFLESDEAGDPFLASLASRSAHVIPPVRWQAGEAHVTLLVDDGTDLRDLTAPFPGARLLSKRALASGSARGALASPLLLPELTPKQASALAAAFDAGYYEYPRRVTTEDVSAALRLARSTFQEHLSRAERHVVRAMLPLVRMRAAPLDPGSPRAQDEALAVYSRFSRELGLYIRLEVLGGRISEVQLTRRPAPGAPTSHPYLTRILENVRTGEDDLADIPLHLEVTPFEREVLEFLRTLPRGETITYGELARRLGRPGAARAVGQAVARNPVPVVIPCHRVLRSSGDLGGYSGGNGPETKRKLLEREGALPRGDGHDARSRTLRPPRHRLAGAGPSGR